MNRDACVRKAVDVLSQVGLLPVEPPNGMLRWRWIQLCFICNGHSSAPEHGAA